MPVKIRLARHGKKKAPFYHIVIADSRSPRDGRFIERIGSYNPNTNPATIDIDFEKALQWLQNGAQPTDTCRAILSYNGILYKNHLLNGVKKGALTIELADSKFNTWLKEKETKIQSKKDKVGRKKDEESKKKLAAETQTREAKAQAIAKKLAAQADAAKAEEAAPAEETPAAE